VYFPPGVYCTTGLQIRVPDVSLIGCGAGNWLFGSQPNKGSTLKYIGAAHGTLIDISPVVPSGQFTWCNNIRDMNLDCNGGTDFGLFLGSVCNSEFANLNVLNAGTASGGAAIYIYAAATTAVGYSAHLNVRNVNVTLGAGAAGVVIDNALGTTPGL